MDSIFEIKKRVLVVSGDPYTLAEMKRKLMGSFDVVLSAFGAAAREALDGYETDAVIICLGDEPGGERAEICGLAAGKGIPVLFLARYYDEGDELNAFNLGAVDYSLIRSGAGEPLIKRINLRIRANKGTVDKPSAAGKKILIAEDVKLNQNIIEAILSEVNGLTLEFADNGREAVEKFKADADAYSLVFMDIYMPEMDGLSAAKAIRGLDIKAAKRVPIIALTADTAEDDVAGFKNAGMNGYLEKPVDGDKLMEMVSYFTSR